MAGRPQSGDHLGRRRCPAQAGRTTGSGLGRRVRLVRVGRQSGQARRLPCVSPHSVGPGTRDRRESAPAVVPRVVGRPLGAVGGDGGCETRSGRWIAPPASGSTPSIVARNDRLLDLRHVRPSDLRWSGPAAFALVSEGCEGPGASPRRGIRSGRCRVDGVGPAGDPEVSCGIGAPVRSPGRRRKGLDHPAGHGAGRAVLSRRDSRSCRRRRVQRLGQDQTGSDPDDLQGIRPDRGEGQVAHRAKIEATGNAGGSTSTAAMLVTATATALAPNRTAVDLVTTLSLTGRPAQFGRGVMVDVGNKLIGQFADCVSNKLGRPHAGRRRTGRRGQSRRGRRRLRRAGSRRGTRRRRPTGRRQAPRRTEPAVSRPRPRS